MSQSKQRLPNATRLLDDLPNAELIEAADGRRPEDIADLDVFDGTLHHPSYPFPLRDAEIGVFQSHRRCWQTILDRQWDKAIIAEDDLAVDPIRLERAIAMLEQSMTPDMVVRLPVKDRETPAKVISSDGDMKLMLPKIVALQCVCIAVGARAAERLLSLSQRIDRPVDTWLQMHWVTGQPIHTLLPTGNREIAQDIGGSTIQVKTATRGKLAREAKRTLYRAQIALRPQKG